MAKFSTYRLVFSLAVRTRRSALAMKRVCPPMPRSRFSLPAVSPLPLPSGRKMKSGQGKSSFSPSFSGPPLRSRFPFIAAYPFTYIYVCIRFRLCVCRVADLSTAVRLLFFSLRWNSLWWKERLPRWWFDGNENEICRKFNLWLLDFSDCFFECMKIRWFSLRFFF